MGPFHRLTVVASALLQLSSHRCEVSAPQGLALLRYIVRRRSAKELRSSRKFRVSLLIPLVLSFSFKSEVVLAKTTNIGPSDAWCDTINRAAPGDEIVLGPGSYTTPCWITARGLAGFPILVRSQSKEPSQQAVFAYPGSTANVLELRNAAHLVLRAFYFAPTQEGVDAVRIWKGNDIVIENNLFQGIGGISVSANTYDGARITIRDNTFRNLKATGLYFGCHNGVDCHATDLVIERNLIDGVTPINQREIGYGLEIKLNSYGSVKDNTIYRTKGPGIMTYGSNRGDPASVVEGNYIEGSLTEGGIVVGGGLAIIRNNVLVGNHYGGISVQNYGSRNLQQNVWIVHNTVCNNKDSGINLQGWNAESNNVLAFNAILPSSGTPALRPAAPPGVVVGNVNCSLSSPCFGNTTLPPYDLWPVSTGPLIDAAGIGTQPWRPLDDFMGTLRNGAADVGAFERASLSVDHRIGGGNPRPPRISVDHTPPLASTGLQLQ